MQVEYIYRLSPDIAEMTALAEQAAGIVIDVIVEPERAVMACDMDKHGATMFTPSGDYFEDGPVLHELLHIRRILVDHIPRIIECDDCDHVTPEMLAGLASLDNDLEHLLIVPQELALRPERQCYWEERTLLALNKLLNGTLNEDDTRRHLMLKGLFIDMVLPDCTALESARLLEQILGLTDEAQAFRDKMKVVLSKKEEAVLLAFDLLNIPRTIASLEYIDTSVPATKEVPLSVFM